MSAAGHFRPVLNVVAEFDPRSRGKWRFFRKMRNAAGHFDTLSWGQMKQGISLFEI
jgi:hypothetical protein